MLLLRRKFSCEYYWGPLNQVELLYCIYAQLVERLTEGVIGIPADRNCSTNFWQAIRNSVWDATRNSSCRLGEVSEVRKTPFLYKHREIKLLTYHKSSSELHTFLRYWPFYQPLVMLAAYPVTFETSLNLENHTSKSLVQLLWDSMKTLNFVLSWSVMHDVCSEQRACANASSSLRQKTGHAVTPLASRVCLCLTWKWLTMENDYYSVGALLAENQVCSLRQSWDLCWWHAENPMQFQGRHTWPRISWWRLRSWC